MLGVQGSWRKVAAGGSFAVVATAVCALHAQSEGPVIWYRSSEGCPDGAAFLARLQSRAQGARLAQVNDRIDFVVTLGSSEGRSSGKLERQTVGSTVAIREIETQSCEEVADALALTLTLTLNPSGSGAQPEASGEVAPAPEPAPAEPAHSLAAPGPRASGTRQAASRSPPTSTRVPPDDREGPVGTHASNGVWLFGAQLGAVTGPTGAVGPKSAVFMEYEPGWAALPGASARFGLFFARVEDDAPGLSVTMLGGHVDACPVDFVGPKIHLRPCLGFELGTVLASGRSTSRRDDQGAWGAVLGSARASWVATPGFALELEGGAFAPLVRYAFVSGTGSELYQADSVGFFGALGAALRVP